ncbi:MAG: hypothetical protein ACRC7S_08440 [Cetobacterium sp.]
MLDGIMKNLGATAKWLIGAGAVGALLLVAALRGCSADTSTNKHDAAAIKTVSDTAVKLQEIQDKKEKEFSKDRSIEKSAEAQRDVLTNQSNNLTEIELKKLEIDSRDKVDLNNIENRKMDLEDKKTVDANKQMELQMQLEMKKLELIEAQKLKNEMELEKLKMENTKIQKEKEIAEKEKTQRAKANAAAAAEKAKREKEKEELELLKALQ